MKKCEPWRSNRTWPRSHAYCCSRIRARNAWLIDSFLDLAYCSPSCCGLPSQRMLRHTDMPSNEPGPEDASWSTPKNARKCFPLQHTHQLLGQAISWLCVQTSCDAQCQGWLLKACVTWCTASHMDPIQMPLGIDGEEKGSRGDWGRELGDNIISLFIKDLLWEEDLAFEQDSRSYVKWSLGRFA